jgi:hypothetical protein
MYICRTLQSVIIAQLFLSHYCCPLQPTSRVYSSMPYTSIDNKLRCVLEWADDHPHFDTSFVHSLHTWYGLRQSLTTRQHQALDRIIERWHIVCEEQQQHQEEELEADSDHDSDVQCMDTHEGASVPLRCCITFMTMEAPVRSACGHVFSRAGIEHYLQRSRGRMCPVAGCGKQVLKAQLTNVADFNPVQQEGPSPHEIHDID